MIAINKKIGLGPDTLSPRNLTRLKWSATLAIMGLPILVQILGAIMLYSSDYPVLTSIPVLAAYIGAAFLIILAGLFTLSNRVFLRFSSGRQQLEEWEEKTQKDAFAFSYWVIVKGALLGFAVISALGLLLALDRIGVINFEFGRAFVLNIEAIAAITITLTYLILFLPTLFIAWTLPPMTEGDGEIN